MNLKLSLEDQIEMLTADVDAIGFYKSLGFERAGKTVPMWIYAGNEH